MKRSIFILVAALLVLLVYPSTHPYAKSPTPGLIIGPSVITPLSGADPPIAYSDDSDDDADDGDGDAIGGYRERDRKPNGSAYISSPGGRAVVVLKMWWNFMIWIR
jgi:hypothetical protein